MITYYYPDKHSANFVEFITELKNVFYKARKKRRDLVVLCIGTPYLFADSLGPLTGCLLKDRLSGYAKKPFFVYGTVADPVTAVNYREKCRLIKKQHRHAFIVAVDASLGMESHIGLLTLKKGKLAPGSGIPRRNIKKGGASGLLSGLSGARKSSTLSPIGQLSLTGIVQSHISPDNRPNAASEQKRWHETPLKLPQLYAMASFLAEGIERAAGSLPLS